LGSQRILSIFVGKCSNALARLLRYQYALLDMTVFWELVKMMDVLTIQPETLYWVELGGARMQVRTIKRAFNEPASGNHWWLSISAKSGTQLMLPESAFRQRVEQ
jgi:hypothetical protein